MWASLVLVGAVLASVGGQTTQVSQCIAHTGELPINIYIENCTTPPCLLPQLQDAIIQMVFRAPRTMTSMRTLGTAYMVVFGITIPIPYDLGHQAETCNFLLNSFCPVLEGEVLLYQLNMFIEPFMTVGTQVPIEFRVVDQDNEPVICLRVTIRVTEPVNALTGPAANATFVESSN